MTTARSFVLNIRVRVSWQAYILKASIPQDFRVFQGGTLEIEARASEPDTGLTIKVDCEWPCSSGEIRLPEPLSDDWTTISISVDDLTLGGLDLQAVDTGLVFWPSDLGLVSIDIKAHRMAHDACISSTAARHRWPASAGK